jgi:hypothetical protein
MALGMEGAGMVVWVQPPGRPEELGKSSKEAAEKLLTAGKEIEGLT